MKIHVLALVLVLMLSGCIQESNIQSNALVSFEYPNEVRHGSLFSIKAKISNNMPHSIENFEINIKDKFNCEIKDIICNNGIKKGDGCFFSKIDAGDENVVIFNLKSPEHYYVSDQVSIYPKLSYKYESSDQSNLFIPIVSYQSSGNEKTVKKFVTSGPVKAEIIITPEEKSYVLPGENINVKFKFSSDNDEIVIKKDNIVIHTQNLNRIEEDCDFDSSLKPKEDIKVNYAPIFCSFEVQDKTKEYAVIIMDYTYVYEKEERFKIKST